MHTNAFVATFALQSPAIEQFEALNAWSRLDQATKVAAREWERLENMKAALEVDALERMRQSLGLNFVDEARRAIGYVGYIGYVDLEDTAAYQDLLHAALERHEHLRGFHEYVNYGLADRWNVPRSTRNGINQAWLSRKTIWDALAFHARLVATLRGPVHEKPRTKDKPEKHKFQLTRTLLRVVARQLRVVCGYAQALQTALLRKHLLGSRFSQSIESALG